MNIKVLAGGILFFTVGICHKLGLRATRLGKYRDSTDAILHQQETAPFYLAMGIGLILWSIIDPDSQVSYAVNMVTVFLFAVTMMKEFRYWTNISGK